jgi:tRNA(Glu) U13 pseudouridine synthase TruD
MSFANINPDWFYTSLVSVPGGVIGKDEGLLPSSAAPTRSIEASIKTWPDDFFVKEIGLNADRDGIESNGIEHVTRDLCIDKAELKAINCTSSFKGTKNIMKARQADDTRDPAANILQPEVSVVGDVLRGLVEGSEIAIIFKMNNWLLESCQKRDERRTEVLEYKANEETEDSKDPHVIMLSAAMNNEQSQFVLRSLRKKFPHVLLKTTASQTLEAAESKHRRHDGDVIPQTTVASSATESLKLISVSPDRQFQPLIDIGLSFEDINKLTIFFHNGSSHPLAQEGVVLSTSLDKDCRTLLHAAVRRLCPSLETVTSSGNDLDKCGGKRKRKSVAKDGACETNGGNKSIKVCWSNRALAKGSRRPLAESGKEEHNNTQRFIRSEVVLGFVLFKRDIEQLAAIQQIASLCCVSPSNVATAGIKDKKAITFQRCSVIIRANCSCCLKAVLERRMSLSTDVVNNEQRTGSTEKCALRVAVLTAIQSLLTVSFKALLPDEASQTKSMIELCCGPASFVEEPQTQRRRGIIVGGISLLDGPVQVGELWGNDFKIAFRKMKPASPPSYENARALLDTAISTVQCFGFPNFYGSQRMGYSRFIESPEFDHQQLSASMSVTVPVGPLIGYYLLSQQFELAIHTIVLDAFQNNNHYFSKYRELLDLEASQRASPRVTQRSYKNEFNNLLAALSPTASRCSIIVRGMIRYGFVPTMHPVNVAENGTSRASVGSWKWEQNDCVCVDLMMRAQSTENTKTTSLFDIGHHIDCCVDILLQVPFATRSLWISAYQSWLWNQAVNYRLERLGPLALPGDMVYVDDNNMMPGTGTPQEIKNIMELSETEIIADDEADAAESGGVQPMTAILEKCPDTVDGRSIRHLSKSEIDELNDHDRRLLLKRVVMPLFGSKVLLPNNESGM